MNVTINTTRTITIDEDDVKRILLEWARREHGFGEAAVIRFSPGYDWERPIISEDVRSTE